MRGVWVVILAVGCGAASASAGTKGGIYDFSYFLGQPHPLSGQQVGVGNTGAPPPYNPAPATGSGPYNPYGQTKVAAAPAQPQAPADAGLFDGSGNWLDRWYIRAGGGYDLPDDLNDNAGGNSVNINVDDGYMGEVALGHYFGRSFRGELELSYRQTALTEASSGGSTNSNISGHYKVYAGMLNGFYDLHFDFPVVPYVGVGIGMARIKVDSVTVGGASTQADSATEFAYQGIAGVSWRFADDFVASIDYRYFGTAGDNENTTMTVAAGLRYDL